MYTTTKPGLGRLPWILLGVAMAAVLALYLIARSARKSSPGTTVLKVGESVPAWKPGPGWASAIPPERRAGEAISIPIFPPFTEEQGNALFGPMEGEMLDPVCGKLYKPNQRFTIDFPEYPGKRIEFVVNSRSMREDEEPRAEKPLLRVLVAGDSHTDGVCTNSESFANLAEDALRQRARTESQQRGESFDPTSIEVLNAGKGSHSFYNYLGVLERNLDLQPDIFVVTVYGGNDFEEALTIWHFYNNEGKRPVGARGYWKLLKAAVDIHPDSLSQALSSVKYFATYPDQKQIAVKAGSEVFEQIQALCRERGIRLIAIYLPSRPEVEQENSKLKLEELLKALDLQSAALDSTKELADGLLARLTELGIETIDMRPAFGQSRKSAYWNLDWHINLIGHQVVAKSLIKALSARR